MIDKMDIISGIIGYCILGALVAIVVVITFISYAVFAEAANRRAWKDNLMEAYVKGGGAK